MLGARRNYAVPLVLHEHEGLARFFTDFYSSRGWPRLLGLLPKQFHGHIVSRILGRDAGGIPARLVTAFNSFGMEYYWRLARARTEEQSTRVYLWGGRTFCRLVLNALPRVTNGVFTFNSAGLELLRAFKERGLPAAMEQTIAPRRVELEIMKRERAAFPGWERADGAGDSVVEEYAEREESEWKVSDAVLCGSEYVCQGIRKCGGPSERCHVVPYAVDVRRWEGKPRKRHGGALRVLFVGTVGLRKGAQYVLECARKLRGRAAFRMVGPIAVSSLAERDLAACVELTGAVPHSMIQSHFEWADVFLLPSLCEGSAAVCYEALASALPVVCTPNTGSVVRDGEEGFIVPASDPAAIVERLERLIDDSSLYEEMSRRASSRADAFTIESYGSRLWKILRGMT